MAQYFCLMFLFSVHLPGIFLFLEENEWHDLSESL